MQRFLISYDLHAGSEEGYENLIEAFEALGAVRFQLSVWYLKDEDDEHTCEKLRRRLRKHMRARDGIAVVRFDKWSGSKNFARISES